MKTCTFFALLILALPVLASCSAQDPKSEPVSAATGDGDVQRNAIFGEIGDTDPQERGKVTIRGVGTFEFTPHRISTLRDDIFRKGHFSIFDVLVHLDELGNIELEYHFDEKMNTFVIDSLNGESSWWYRVFYHGGWSENNVFRMDHFPYKDRMDIVITQIDEKLLGEMYGVFQTEVKRLKDNGGRIVIPEVVIRGPTTSMKLQNVEVRPHNLRSDVFREGVVTAIDVILSLGERQELTYDLRWYEYIGSAIVENYFVDRINSDVSRGRCGFVYESGSRTHGGFRGNHIHLPSDTRVINAPEYLTYFWICI
jgi:hypothetical protein